MSAQLPAGTCHRNPGQYSAKFCRNVRSDNLDVVQAIRRVCPNASKVSRYCSVMQFSFSLFLSSSFIAVVNTSSPSREHASNTAQRQQHLLQTCPKKMRSLLRDYGT